MVDAVILAGGLGTRLREAVPHLPKPLAPIRGVAFLDLLLEHIEQSGVVKKVVLAIGYKAEVVLEHFSKWSGRLELEFSFEETPLGTGGAVKKAIALTNTPRVFVMNGDSYLACPLGKMYECFHPPVTIAYTHVEDASRFGNIEFDVQGKVIAFHEKKANSLPGWINGGVYLFDRTVFDKNMPAVFSLEKDFFPGLIKEGMASFRVDGLFIDIGTPESYIKAQEILEPLILE
ncbi:MAG: nucleotidyltransferase family protein [Simkania sp.]|nr:nucleotidyltransferase family protein [Simkania sp.]